MSLPAIIKHLDVLSYAGLITRTRTGRTVTCRLAPAPVGEAKAWIERHLRFWEIRLDNLAAVVEAICIVKVDPWRLRELPKAKHQTVTS